MLLDQKKNAYVLQEVKVCKSFLEKMKNVSLERTLRNT